MRILKPLKISLAVLSLTCIFSGCSWIGGTTDKPQDVSNDNTIVDAPDEFPQPAGLLNDFTGVIPESEKAEIEEALRQLQKKDEVDLGIAIVDSTNGKNIFDYSLAMARQWKVGSKNGGALLVVAVKDRHWWIQTDERLKKELSDEEVKKIGDVMVPAFKEDKYAKGIKECVRKFVSVLDQKAASKKAEPKNK